MKTRWWSRRAVTLHVALLVAVPLFLTLGGWQLRRALHHNMLSWAYTFEWPFFAAYAAWMWWKLVHEETTPSPDGQPTDLHGQAPAQFTMQASASNAAGGARADWDPYDEADPELAAYNRYLAGLHAKDPKR